jgi:hypothetical protein
LRLWRNQADKQRADKLTADEQRIGCPETPVWITTAACIKPQPNFAHWFKEYMAQLASQKHLYYKPMKMQTRIFYGTISNLSFPFSIR